jgi:hypothetical protein
MKSDKIRDVRSAYAEFLATASNFYEVPTCGLRVLAARPLRTRERGTFELFGDYSPDSMLIRVWMRTAVRKEVTSFGTFLSTLCHEFCHHLDFRRFGVSDSWLTRGFYERGALLYHFARGTPRKNLCWVPTAIFAFHPSPRTQTAHPHRVASVILFIVITLIVRDVSFIFLIVLFLVWLFPKKDITSRRAIRTVCVEALWAYSAHVHMVLCAVGKSSGC